MTRYYEFVDKLKSDEKDAQVKSNPFNHIQGILKTYEFQNTNGNFEFDVDSNEHSSKFNEMIEILNSTKNELSFMSGEIYDRADEVLENMLYDFESLNRDLNKLQK